MYKYETHLHTLPVSKCASATVRDALEFYKRIGYDGVFITNHFIDGNINVNRALPYAEKIEFYFSDYERAVSISEEIGISVFCGVEMSYGGTDFLVYGPMKEWYLAHPEIENMKKSQLLTMLREAGALVIQAHPFREASYIDHIRLFPRHVHGVEVVNASRNAFENQLAEQYAENYGLIKFAGSDNHSGERVKRLGGMESAERVCSEKEFIDGVISGKITYFVQNNPLINKENQNET